MIIAKWLVHVCEMTLICVIWLMHMCDLILQMFDVTYSHVWHDLCMYVKVAHSHVTRLFHMYDMTHSHLWHDSLACMTWLHHVCYVGTFTFTRVTWLIHMHNVTGSSISVTWHVHMWHVMPESYVYVPYVFICMCSYVSSTYPESCVYKSDVFVCVFYVFESCVTWDAGIICVRSGWRRPIGRLKLQVIFRKRASNYRALLRKMTYKVMASYGSSPPCMSVLCLWIMCDMGLRNHMCCLGMFACVCMRVCEKESDLTHTPRDMQMGRERCLCLGCERTTCKWERYTNACVFVYVNVYVCVCVRLHRVVRCRFYSSWYFFVHFVDSRF